MNHQVLLNKMWISHAQQSNGALNPKFRDETLISAPYKKQLESKPKYDMNFASTGDISCVYTLHSYQGLPVV